MDNPQNVITRIKETKIFLIILFVISLVAVGIFLSLYKWAKLKEFSLNQHWTHFPQFIYYILLYTPASFTIFLLVQTIIAQTLCPQRYLND